MEIESIMNIMVIKSKREIRDLYELFKYNSTTNSDCKNIAIDLMKTKKKYTEEKEGTKEIDYVFEKSVPSNLSDVGFELIIESHNPTRLTDGIYRREAFFVKYLYNKENYNYYEISFLNHVK